MSWHKPREISDIKLCHNHKDHRKGVYVFKIDNGVVDRKHQRFFCFECIKKYSLEPFIVHDTRRSRNHPAGAPQKRAETGQVWPLSGATGVARGQGTRDACAAPVPTLHACGAAP